MERRRKRGMVLVSVGVMILALGIFPARSEANLIRNPGLDGGSNHLVSGYDQAIIPEWTNINEVMYVANDGHDALGCAQIDWGSGKLRQVGIAVTGGQVYTFSYWTKYVVGRWGSTRGSANVYLQYYDAGGVNVGFHNLLILPPADGSWVQAVAVWTIPVAATEARIYSAGVSSNGGILLDDFSLVPEPSLLTLFGLGSWCILRRVRRRSMESIAG